MYIITAERNTKYVYTTVGKWGFYQPGINHDTWKVFDSANDANQFAAQLSSQRKLSGFTVSVEHTFINQLQTS